MRARIPLVRLVFRSFSSRSGWSLLPVALALGLGAGCDADNRGLGGVGLGDDLGLGGDVGAVKGGAGGGRTGGAPGASGGNGGGSMAGASGAAGGTGGPASMPGTGGASGADAGTMASQDGAPPGRDATADTTPEQAGPRPGAGTWTADESLPGGPRQEVGVAAVRHLVFVVAGQGSSGAGRRVEAFDSKTGRWERHPDLPVSTDHPNVAGAGDKLYVLGGTGTDNVYEYDPFADERRWVRKQDMPTDRAAAATAAIGTKIYVAGGQRGGQGVTDFAAYDISTDTWDTSLPPLPAPGRNHVPGAAVDGVFYVIGGRIAGPTGGLQRRVDAFDPETKRWTDRAPMPTARGGAGAGVVNGLIVVLGGEGNQMPGTFGVFREVEVYDPRADRWVSLANMRTPRHGMGAAGLDGKLYVPAGALRQGGGSQVPIMEVLTF